MARGLYVDYIWQKSSAHVLGSVSGVAYFIITDEQLHYNRGLIFPMQAIPSEGFPFLCPRHSKNGGGALSVTPVSACVRASVRASVRPLSKFGVRSITFEILHRFNSNLVSWYIILKHKSSAIWVTIH